MYQLLADIVLAVHTSVVLFVVLGLVLILIGWQCRWRWVCNPVFRWLHLAAIAVVVVQSWAGVLCPLTTLEMWLRAEAGEALYSTSFVQHWLQRLLYYEAPGWVFVTAYTTFGILVLLSWYVVPPRHARSADRG